MLFLLGSIVLTSWLTLAFKMLERMRVNAFQAIVFNYCTCVITGSLVNGEFLPIGSVLQTGWFRWALLMGAMFVSIFNLLAVTTRRIGVAVASVANKLSLVIPFVFSVYLYKEELTGLKLTGAGLALFGVALTCWQDNRKSLGDQEKNRRFILVLLPVTLFLSSGLLDTLIKFTEHRFLTEGNKDSFLVTAFASAAIIGLSVLTILSLSGRIRFSFRAVLAGIAIGIPNYFSIWCLIRVLKDYPGNSSAIIPVNNMGIVLFSAVMAWLFFKEKLSALNWLGIILSVTAIACIAFG